MNKKSTFVKWRRYLPLYLMLIPGVVYIFINNYIPMAGLIMAFEKYDYNCIINYGEVFVYRIVFRQKTNRVREAR